MIKTHNSHLRAIFQENDHERCLVKPLSLSSRGTFGTPVMTGDRGMITITVFFIKISSSKLSEF